MIGGNDVIDAVQATVDLESEESPNAIINAAVDAIGDNISLLIERGAKKILVVNSANLGSVPAIRIAADAAGLPRILALGIATSLTKKFNKRLAKRLDQIQAVQTVNSVQIEEFNLFSYLERVRFVGRLFGLNISDACFNTDLYRDFSMLMAEREFDPGCAPNVPNGKPNFDEFVFFDDLHPSGWVHAAIGKTLAKTARKRIDD